MSNMEDTRAALYIEVKRQTEALAASGWAEDVQAVVVRDLALAFRYAAGGSQPGSVTVAK